MDSSQVRNSFYSENNRVHYLYRTYLFESSTLIFKRFITAFIAFEGFIIFVANIQIIFIIIKNYIHLVVSPASKTFRVNVYLEKFFVRYYFVVYFKSSVVVVAV